MRGKKESSLLYGSRSKLRSAKRPKVVAEEVIDGNYYCRRLSDQQYHRLDGPAVVYQDGTEKWYREGKLHRDQGPAIIKANGDREWWIDGKRDNPRGPAEITKERVAYWHQGVLHRETGPAYIEKEDGQVVLEEWFNQGKLHRTMPPKDGEELLDLEPDSGPGPALTERDEKGQIRKQEYYLDGQCHRVGGPAVVHGDGSREWIEKGKRHRLNAPAFVYADGSEEWWQDGKEHREDGPAMTIDQRQEWWVLGQRHNPDPTKPAYIDKDNVEMYYQNGHLHREDGPAVVYKNDSPDEYHLNGEEISAEEFAKLQELA
jgi:hypothetical protein